MEHQLGLAWHVFVLDGTDRAVVVFPLISTRQWRRRPFDVENNEAAARHGPPIPANPRQKRPNPMGFIPAKMPAVFHSYDVSFNGTLTFRMVKFVTFWRYLQTSIFQYRNF